MVHLVCPTDSLFYCRPLTPDRVRPVLLQVGVQCEFRLSFFHDHLYGAHFLCFHMMHTRLPCGQIPCDCFACIRFPCDRYLWHHLLRIDFLCNFLRFVRSSYFH